MNDPGVRSSVRVIRLVQSEALHVVPLVDVPRDGLALVSSQGAPAVAWPDPIGSGWARVPARLEEPARPPDPRVKRQDIPRLPSGVIERWSLEFTGQASEYARLWAINVLLTVLTLGLYLPWARVRSRRFFLRHTQVAGHTMDYHEPPDQLLPRHALCAGLVVGVLGAWAGSRLAGMLALSLALSVWPLLVFMSLTHRMAHISWAHRRLAFDGLCQDVYRAMWAPLAGGGALAWLCMAAAIVRWPGGWLAWGVALAVWLLALPAFVWAWFQFKQQHLLVGPLRLMWKGSRPAVLMLFARTLSWVMLTSLMSLGLAALAVAVAMMLGGRLTWSVQGAMLALTLLSVCAAVQPYVQARLQNLVWNKTGNRYLRFRSKLSVSDFVALQFRQAFLLVLTLGLYWPWAVVATRRMRTRSLTVWSRVDAEVLKAVWPTHASHVAGKMAGSPAPNRASA